MRRIVGVVLHPLLDAGRIDGALVEYLAACGDVFATITGHDSRNTGYGVAIAGERWFVKRADAGDVAAIAELESAVRFHAAVRHPAIVPLVAVIHASDGLAIVHPWRDGELLYEPLARERFRALPLPERLAAIEVILDAHVAVARAGFVAVDFYDGSLIYDFAARVIHLIDLDSYRPPYTLDRDRQFGSSRFMAPEEWQRGAAIDERTTVYTLGRAVLVLVGEHAVAGRATAARPADRFATVAELHRAWRT